jgi:hypothetical protein
MFIESRWPSEAAQTTYQLDPKYTLVISGNCSRPTDFSCIFRSGEGVLFPWQTIDFLAIATGILYQYRPSFF